MVNGGQVEPKSNILNWRQIDGQISTSGQPTEAQLAELRDKGVTQVINLGPHSNKGALPDEKSSVEALGMRYIYIPVDFDGPTQADFDQFCAALDELAEQRVHVHCIYNARVSAFFYRYAKENNRDVEKAFALMDGIWRPGGVWARFIGHGNDTDLPNRYLGYDYDA